MRSRMLGWLHYLLSRNAPLCRTRSHRTEELNRRGIKTTTGKQWRAMQSKRTFGSRASPLLKMPR